MLPVVAAVLFKVLQQREGTLPSLLALATVGLLVPGWSVTVILSLLAVVGGVLWRDRLAARWLVVSLAIIVVLAGDWWQPSLAWLLLLVILAKALPANWKTGISAVLAAGVLAIFLPAVRDWSEVARLMALGPILLPALLLPTDNRRTNSIQAVRARSPGSANGGGSGRAGRSPGPRRSFPTLEGGGGPSAASLEWCPGWQGLPFSVLTRGLRAQALADALAIFGIQVSWPYAIAVAAML